MTDLPSSKIFDAGYAIPTYDVIKQTQIFRYRNEMYEIPHGMVPMAYFDKIPAAKIEDVRKVHDDKRICN